jgi:hypothetical protein
MANTRDFKNLIDNYGRSPEQRAEALALMEKVNEEAAANWEDPAWRREMAAVLTSSILEGFTFETFYDQIVSVERVGFDDRVILEEETGLKVFFIAKGGHIEASALVSESMEIPRDTLGFHVYEFEDKMQSNFAKSAATLRNLAVRRLDWGVNKQIKALIEAAIDSGGPYYISGAGLDKTALDTAIREVRDESQTGVVSLYGRSVMVDQIADFTGFADEALEEIRKRGRLGVYRGASVVQARNWKDEDGVSFIPANELYVISDDSALFAMYGGLKSKEYVEQDNWYWHYIGRQDFGGVLSHPERTRRFVDTAITP